MTVGAIVKGFAANRRCFRGDALAEQKVKMAVFSADEQVAAAVAVEVERGRAGVVGVEPRLGQRAEIFQHRAAVPSFHIPQNYDTGEMRVVSPDGRFVLECESSGIAVRDPDAEPGAAPDPAGM